MVALLVGTLMVGCKGGSSENTGADTTATDSAAVETAQSGILTSEALAAKLKDWTIPEYNYSNVYQSGSNIASVTGNLINTGLSKAKAIQYSVTDYESVGMCTRPAEFENIDTAKAIIDAYDNSSIVSANTTTLAGKEVMVINADLGPETSTGGGKIVYMRRAIREGDRFVTVQVTVGVKDNDFAAAEAYGKQVMEHLSATIGR
jgi:hypothetical protein